MASELEQAISKRRTFAIISHPDAGKTTITERLLLMGGAIKMAGAVKAKKSKLYATSDWMEIEKQRGISVTSSVLKFSYQGKEVNLIDTPGHQDFSEDTYRTLTAVDSTLMLLDAAQGVEAQTKKLFHVCHMQKTPVIAFVNKMDRDGRDPWDLLEEMEQVLGLETFPMVWPLGSGEGFQGLYHRLTETLQLFATNSHHHAPYQSHQFKELLCQRDDLEELCEHLELLEVAGRSWNREAYLRGELAPVFFGSAIKELGVRCMLDFLVDTAPAPKARQARERVVMPEEEKFSAFIFKIQANMDPAHRDRVGFMRICSGVFERDMKIHVVRLGRKLRLARPTEFMAQDRSLIERAYPGDIVGVHDPGVLCIGDTLTTGETLHFQGIPVFAPEHFALVQLQDPLKSKQLRKGLSQLSEEGAVQVFHDEKGQKLYLGVVGTLQFDVVMYRLSGEYGVNASLQKMPYTVARWVDCEDHKLLKEFLTAYHDQTFYDTHQQPVVLADQPWRIDLWQERHPLLKFRSISESLG